MPDDNSTDFIDLSKVQIDLPLLTTVQSLDKKIEAQFPGQNSQWPEALGIAYLYGPSALENGGYWCTPLNTLSFARTGVDGEHFSFLVCNNSVNDRSPIIYTAPCESLKGPTIVVAPNFHIFMRLSLRYGCFLLGDLVSNLEKTLEIYEANSERPVEIETDGSSQRHKEIRDFVAKTLSLESYQYATDEFARLQQQYRSLPQMSADYHEWRSAQ